MAADKSLALDRYGMALSIGCAIHCAALPIGMSLFTASGLAWIVGPPFEWAILAGTFLLGSWRLIKSFVEHRNPTTLFLFGAGLIFIAAAKMIRFNFPYNEAWFMAAGGLLIATAHFRNLRLCACGPVHAH
jgi:uncharacterized membrane protein